MTRQQAAGRLGQAVVLERHDGEPALACHVYACPHTAVHVHVDTLEEGWYRAPHGDVLLLGGRDGALRLALGESIDIQGELA